MARFIGHHKLIARVVVVCVLRDGYNNVEFKKIEPIVSMQYFTLTYGLSKYGEGCDWEFIDGGAQIILTGGMTTRSVGDGSGGLEPKTCSDRSRLQLALLSFAEVVSCWPCIAVTFGVLVGVTHRFFEFALLWLLSKVFFEDSLPGAIEYQIIRSITKDWNLALMIY